MEKWRGGGVPSAQVREGNWLSPGGFRSLNKMGLIYQEWRWRQHKTEVQVGIRHEHLVTSTATSDWENFTAKAALQVNSPANGFDFRGCNFSIFISEVNFKNTSWS